MKNILIVVFAMFLNQVLMAQAKEGTVEFQKKQQPAAVLVLAYPPDMINAALNDFLSKKGKSKGSDSKGFTIYRNTQQLQGDSANADLYFKIERMSRQDKQTTVVSLLLTPVQGVPATVGVNNLTMDQAKTYLNELIPAIEGYGLEQQIKAMNDIIAVSESRYKELVKDDADLEEKRAELEKKILAIRQQQAIQTADIDGKKEQLSALVSQRKS